MINTITQSPIVTKEFNYNYNENIDDDNAKFQKDEIGKYPSLFIDNIQIENNDIEFLNLKNDSTYPLLNIIFSDPTGKLFKDYCVDNTIISLFKKSDGGLESDGEYYDAKDIKMDFKIMNFKTINGTSGEKVKFEINGVLDVDNLYLYKFESYEDTSFNLLKTLASEMSLGFVTNITNSTDQMKWINPGLQRQDFIKEIIKNSYIDDTTYLFGYIDFYYNLNYIDINKQLNSDISSQRIIDGGNNINKNDSKNDQFMPLILTNNTDKSSSSLYINKYTINQDSTDININSGYRYKYMDYNKTDDKVSIFNLDSISDDSKGGIILKGNPFTNNNLLYNESIKNSWMGKIDLDNVHEKYLEAELSNKNNLNFLQKLKISIRLKTPNYTLYRFQLVNLELYDFTQLEDENTINEKKTDTDTKTQNDIINDSKKQYDSKIIHRLSGEWLITTINFFYSDKESNYQEITLVKRELTEEYNFPNRDL